MAAVLGLGVWLAVEHQRRLSLIEEHRALAQQRDQMAELIANNERLSNLLAQTKGSRSLSEDESRELLRLRGQAGVLRQQTRELGRVREENRQAHTALEATLKNQTAAPKSAATADYWPQDSWAFKGYGSPDATLQTSLWAANTGDLKALMASVTGDLQKVIEDDVKGKSETEVQVKAMDEVMGFKSVRVVSREPQGEDTVVLTFEAEVGQGSRIERMVMKKVGSDWKLVGSPSP
jgi:hypothetical protein